MHNYMLALEISGIKCIKDPVRVEFYKAKIDRNFNPDMYRVKAIYGENGSGKSALITAVQILRDIIVDPGYLMNTENVNLLIEIINKESQCLTISCLFMSESDEKTVYRYEVDIRVGGIYGVYIGHEAFQKRGLYGDFRDVYRTSDGRLNELLLSSETERVRIATQNLLRIQTVVSMLSNNVFSERMNDLLAPLYNFARSIYVYIDNDDLHSRYIRKNGMIRSIDDQDKEIVSPELSMIRKENYGRYEEQIRHLTEFVRLFKRDLTSIDIDKKDNGAYYVCDLIFNYGKYQINQEFESTGIRKLIRIFSTLSACASGNIAFLDEMDANINDVYLNAMIKYLADYGEGQLCFTSHDTEPMDVLRQYKKSIDFLSTDNHLVSWIKNGHYSPRNMYREGMVEHIPMNVDPTDFIGILGD